MPTDETDPLAGLPDHDPGEVPEGFVDPIENRELPWITAASEEDYRDLHPPLERLDEEPAEVEVDLHVDPVTGERMRMLAPCVVPGINLRDYSKTPQGRGWGSPCSVKLARVQLSEAAVSVDYRVAELVGLIMRANEAQGYRYRKADTGAYNCRKIAGTTSWSWHSWALAIDSNWQTNPYTSPLRTDRPEWERARWNRYGFAGGWDYSGKKDAMHAEFIGTPAQAQAALEIARRELGGGVGPAPTPTPAPAPSSGWHDIAMGGVTDLHARGEQVRRDQADLIDTGFGVGSAGADGMAGDDTITAIRSFQAAAGIGVDGAMGPQTRAAIHKVASFPGSTNYRAFQQRLHDRGWKITVDGKWGPASKSTLAAFQREKGLTPDGSPGPITWTALWLRGL